MNKNKYLDLTLLEPLDELDEEELAFHNELINGKTISVDSLGTRKYYSKIFKESNNRSRAVNIRLKEQDYMGLKTKALELGMPYQSLLNSIIHQYLTGKLKTIVH
jgi:predicted DNA binding CopG/RHH family protein